VRTNQEQQGNELENIQLRLPQKAATRLADLSVTR
jgi:hypothetical protein